MKYRRFRVHWNGGKTQDVATRHDGSRIEAAAAAMAEAGIGAGAAAALDYWEEITEQDIAKKERNDGDAD